MSTVYLLPGPGVVVKHGNLVILAVGAPLDDIVDNVRAAAGHDDPETGFSSVVSYLRTAPVDGAAVVLLERQGLAEIWATGAMRVTTEAEVHDAERHLVGLSLRLPIDTLGSIASPRVTGHSGWQPIEGGAAWGAGVVFGSEHGVQGEPFVTVSLREPLDLTDSPPLPTVEIDNGPTSPDLPMYAAPQMVLGVLSPDGYFNHPKALYCSRTGVKMGASATRALTEGARPPLGVLTFENGNTFSVQYDTVIGREPETDDRVRDETVAALSVSAENQQVSRRHLFMELVEWDVFLTDLGTANGTRLREDPAAQVRKLIPGERTPLRGGAQVFIGTTSFHYHEHHVRR